MSTRREIEFRRATLALAADAKAQIALCPPFVCIGDELVIDWGDALDLYRVERTDGFTEEEGSAIGILDQIITRHSGAANARMFSDAAALADDPRWQEVRIAAAEVCSVFGWKIEPPEKSSAVYVAGGRKE